jgi:hypothetical protein
MKAAIVQRRFAVSAALIATAMLLPCSPVSAETLDAKAVGGLVSGRTWVQKRFSGPGYFYWSWKSDGSVCLKDEKAGSCIDTGRWRLERDSVCYELSWWGKSYGMTARCLRIEAKGEGRYDMVPVDGVTPIEFTVEK